MSEDTVVSKDTEQKANAVQAPVVGQGDEQKAPEVVADVNARLLEESKRNKAKAQELKAKLDEIEKKSLLEKEQFKDLYEKSEAKYQGLWKSLVKERVRSSVSEVAAKQGCLSVDDLLKLGKSDLLQIDEETLEVSGTELFVEEAKKSKPYLFQSTKTPTINATTPGGVVKQKTTTLSDLAKMAPGSEEKNKAWAAAFSVRK